MEIERIEKDQKIKRKNLLRAGLFIILNLLLLYFFKYFSNGLNFADFKFFYIGNILNFLFAISAFAGILILFFQSAKITLSQTKIIFYFSIILILIFAVIFIISVIDFNPSKVGIYPLKKVILGIIIILNQFVQIFILAFSWALIFQMRDHIYFKSFAVSLLVVVILFLFTFLYTTLFLDAEDTIEGDKKVLGIILGAAVYHNNEPSPIFRGRIEKANSLYQKGLIQEIQLTGGNAPGEITEAEAAFNYLRRLNVPAKDIKIEKSTTNTAEQIKFVRQQLQNNRNFDNIVFISDHFHLQRVLEISNFFNVKALGISSETKYSFLTLLFYKLRESVGLLFFWLFAI